MSYSADIWLRGTNHATTRRLTDVPAVESWTDDDVSDLLKQMLRLLDGEKNPEGEVRDVFLRGFSWIVNPYEDGGVLIALEMQLGAVIAGPFDIDRGRLEAMIGRVIEGDRPTPVVH